MTQAHNVQKVQTRRRGGKMGAPGQLDRYEDGSWAYVGNGEASCEDVAQKIIDYERGQNDDRFKHVRAGPLAELLLASGDNAQLAALSGNSVKKPIPRNKAFVAEAPTLQTVVAQLLKHEEALRGQLLAQQAPNKSAKTLGTVAGGGLALPYEP